MTVSDDDGDSDADNDLLTCDHGEACDAWLTTDRPTTLQLNGDRSNLDFPAGYLVSLPSQQSADDPTVKSPQRPPGLTRSE